LASDVLVSVVEAARPRARRPRHARALEERMRTAISTALVLFALAAGATPANAQNQGVTFTFGYFAPKGQDSRVAGDVLNADRCLDVSFQCEPLLFDVSDFGGLSFSGEYSIGIGKYFEAAFDVGFTQQTVPSIYALVTRPDGSEIQQDLKLRIVPVTGLVRFIPTGRHAPVQPYFGIGVAALNWHYAESGEFVDPSDGSIFRAQYIADGTEAAPVVVGGLRAPMGNKYMIGGEVRYQKAEADLSNDFLGNKLDLGGFTYQATFTVRF
jgi:hypothetical protein